MKNKYDGKCYVCGLTVPAGAGEMERVGGKWRAYHPRCRPALRAGSPAGALIADHLTPVSARTAQAALGVAHLVIKWPHRARRKCRLRSPGKINRRPLKDHCYD